MLFKGFIPLSGIDIDVSIANGTYADWYSSIDELLDDYGSYDEITEIIIIDFELEIDNHIMTFENIGMN